MKRWLLASLLALALVGVAAGCGGGEGDDSATPTQAGGIPFDRAFIDAMVPHHEGAIEMARAAKRAGLTQPDLMEVAEAIITTQQAEIDRMKRWRAEWFGSSEIDPDGARSLGLSEEEMGMQHDAAALEAAADVDQAFASMMVDHHRGAIRMAELALERGEHPEIRDLAEEIVSAQEREIEILEPHAGGEHHG